MTTTNEDAEIDQFLEKLYNAGWVEGNNYDDTLEQAGIDTEVRSAKELRWCNNVKNKLTHYIARKTVEARLAEMHRVAVANGTKEQPDGDIAAHLRRRKAELESQLHKLDGEQE